MGQLSEEVLRDELILQPVVDEVFGCDTRVDEALDLPDEIAFVKALTEAGGDACSTLLTGKGDAEDEALYGLVLGVVSSCEALPLDIVRDLDSTDSALGRVEVRIVVQGTVGGKTLTKRGERKSL